MGLPFGRLAPTLLGASGADNRIIPSPIHAWLAGSWNVTGLAINSIDNLVTPAEPLVSPGVPADLQVTTLLTPNFGLIPAWLNIANYATRSTASGGAVTQGAAFFLGQGNLAAGGLMWSAKQPAGYDLAGDIYNGAGGAYARLSLGGYPIPAGVGPVPSVGMWLYTWDMSAAPGSRKVRIYAYSVANGNQLASTDVATQMPPTINRVMVGGVWGVGVSGNTLCSTFQLGNAFISDVDGPIVMARLKTAWGF